MHLCSNEASCALWFSPLRKLLTVNDLGGRAAPRRKSLMVNELQPLVVAGDMVEQDHDAHRKHHHATNNNN